MTPILISLLQADVWTWHNDALWGNIFISVENSSSGLCDRLLTPRWTAACTLGPVRLVKDSCGRMEAGREKHGLTVGFTVAGEGDFYYPSSTADDCEWSECPQKKMGYSPL